MTPSIPKRVVHRGRLFPEIQWSPEKKARYQAEITAFRQRCLVIFERVRPELILVHTAKVIYSYFPGINNY
jgi:hypothetical protein